MYDFLTDAKLYARPLRKWALSGFLCGFGGCYQRILPMTSMQLPSEQFREFADIAMASSVLDDSERAARELYVSSVEEYLIEYQEKAIKLHYLLSMVGVFIDFFVAGLAILAVYTAIRNAGIFTEMAPLFLGFIAVSFLVMALATRWAVKIAENTFAGSFQPHPLPWDIQPTTAG